VHPSVNFRRPILNFQHPASKRAQAFINDPKGYSTPPITAPTSSVPPRVIIEEAIVRAKKIIEEAQAEAVRIKANAQSTQPARNSGQPGNDITFLREDDEDDANEASVNPTIQFISPTDDTNDEA
jgi:cell division septum initiation protein DivIVA